MTCYRCHRAICGCPDAKAWCTEHNFTASGPLGPLEELVAAHQERRGEHQVIIQILEAAR